MTEEYKGKTEIQISPRKSGVPEAFLYGDSQLEAVKVISNVSKPETVEEYEEFEEGEEPVVAPDEGPGITFGPSGFDEPEGGTGAGGEPETKAQPKCRCKWYQRCKCKKEAPVEARRKSTKVRAVGHRKSLAGEFDSEGIRETKRYSVVQPKQFPLVRNTREESASQFFYDKHAIVTNHQDNLVMHHKVATVTCTFGPGLAQPSGVGEAELQSEGQGDDAPQSPATGTGSLPNGPSTDSVQGESQENLIKPDARRRSSLPVVRKIEYHVVPRWLPEQRGRNSVLLAANMTAFGGFEYIVVHRKRDFGRLSAARSPEHAAHEKETVAAQEKETVAAQEKETVAAQ